jgi:hypothetical protein
MARSIIKPSFRVNIQTPDMVSSASHPEQFGEDSENNGNNVTPWERPAVFPQPHAAGNVKSDQ